MIFEISKAEEKRARALYESYAKLILDLEAKISELAPETPPFEKWARFNGNEIDTRDITLLDVPRLNNGDESALGYRLAIVPIGQRSQGRPAGQRQAYQQPPRDDGFVNIPDGIDEELPFR